MLKRLLIVLAALSLLATACSGGGNDASGTDGLPALEPTSEFQPEAESGVSELAVPTLGDAAAHTAAMRAGFEGDIDAFADGTRYALNVEISDEPYTVQGQQLVHYVNNTGDTLDEVVFRLYPNVLAITNVVMLVTDVSVDGTPVETESTLDSADPTVFEVSLPDALPPGESTDIMMTFILKLPADRFMDGYGRLSDKDNVLALPSFMPTLSVYRDGDWWRTTGPDMGDPVYSETALWDVQLTVPRGAVAAVSGVVIDEVDNGGTTTYTIVTGPMRDFSVHMSQFYEIVSGEVDGITVNVYSLPGRESSDEFGLQVTLDSVAIFNREFGEYPFAELDVVETPTDAGGIEYPGVYVANTQVWDRENPFFEIVAAHETAHQWWYSLLGNDQVNEPWLDEAMAQYAVEVYFREQYGPPGFEGTREVFQSAYDNYLEQGGQDLAVGLPVEEYMINEAAYGVLVYRKGPLFFNALEDEFGSEAMAQFLRTYFEEFRYGVVDNAAIQQTAEDVFGADLDGMFEEWVGASY